MARGKTQDPPAQRIVSLTVISGSEVSFTVSLDGFAPGVAVTSSTASPATQELLRRPLLQVAPMIDVTNRHFRMLIRCISDLPVLWTEMTWDRAILYNTPDQPEFAVKKTELDRSLESIIGFSEEEHPLVCQLGGCDPDMLARSARLAEQPCAPPRFKNGMRSTHSKLICRLQRKGHHGFEKELSGRRDGGHSSQ